ncbi:MAG TPA: class I SAM-dependent methyltransferase [Streptosporangiaceae bacterium]|nr:class I SAM-dependent methyltransferase [Streptosporangiaceae bacterium]
MNKTIARIIDPDHAGSLTHHFRQQRNEQFKLQFPGLADMHVLDLGGTAISWQVLGLRPRSVTVVNLEHAADPAEPWIKVVRGDACDGGFGSYDLVFSNSLMEHLGGHARRQKFAEVVHESADCWWVQTPYRYFPVEPHWIFPGFQFLPFLTRVMICRHWRTLHRADRPGMAEAIELVASTELISASEMRAYFPDGRIWFERPAGIPKSIVAFRNAT